MHENQEHKWASTQNKVKLLEVIYSLIYWQSEKLMQKFGKQTYVLNIYWASSYIIGP